MSSTATSTTTAGDGWPDAATIKQAASGRWLEILVAVCGFDREILDGKHHPCPACGGTDRFRLIDAAAGALFCNGCFDSKNGDGFAAIQHFRGVGFPETVKLVAQHLGIQSSRNGRAGKPKRKPEDQIRWAEDGQSHHRDLIAKWCVTKLPIKPEAVKAFGGRFCWWPKSMDSPWRCVGFCGRNLKGQTKAVLLYRITGADFPESKHLGRRKSHLAGGSVESWLWAGNLDSLRQAEVIVKCEGLPDALALWSDGLPDGWAAITNACGTKSANPKKLGFGFATEKRVVIVGDADKPGQDGAQRFAAAFVQSGAADVRIVKLPYGVVTDHGKDLRDWLVEGHGFEDFQSLIDAAEPITDEQADKWNPNRSSSTDDEVEISVNLLADAICKENHFAQDAGGKLYRFADGAYRRKAEAYVKAEVKRLCVGLGAADQWGSRLASEIVEFIRVDAPVLWERPPLDVLNVKNGLLRIRDRVLLPHTPDHLSPVQIPAAYDPDAACQAIEEFVGHVFPADAHNLAWEIVAWLMLPSTSMQVAVLLIGEGANGKSTYLSLVIKFVGKSNTSGVSLHKLEADKFAVARLIGKLANICPDLPSEHLAGTSTFKALTGGDTLQAEYKFRDSFDFVPFARLVFSANHPPRSEDASHAFFRRWLVVPFDLTLQPEEQIPREQLDAKLHAPGELSGLLNRALDALERLQQQRGFSRPESVRNAWSEFHATTDPLAVWLDQNTVSDPNAFVPRTDLRIAYNSAAEKRGRPAMGETPFGRALKRLRPEVEDAKRTVNGRRQWVYIGIGMITDRTEADRGDRSGRGSPYSVSNDRSISHAGAQDTSIEGNESSSVGPQEQEGGNSGHSDHSGRNSPPTECPSDRHDWVDEETSDGRIHRVCCLCGKFFGYLPQEF